jgi:hypothetical protein
MNREQTFTSLSPTCRYLMLDISEADDPDPSINPYRRENSSGPSIGSRTACELCGDRDLCFDRHGLSACRDCHRELLPGSGVL